MTAQLSNLHGCQVLKAKGTLPVPWLGLGPLCKIETVMGRPEGRISVGGELGLVVTPLNCLTGRPNFG